MNSSHVRPVASGWIPKIGASPVNLTLAVLIAVALMHLSLPAAKSQALITLHNFTNSSDGGFPAYGTLTMDAAGNLYGTTSQGGASGNGTVFELVNSSGAYSEVVLHDFSGGDGSYPAGGVVADASGNLYGTTLQGGNNGVGVVFELVKTSGAYSFSVLHNFSNSEGAFPAPGLVMDAAGNLFGSAQRGGPNGGGTIFELVSSAGTFNFTVLQNFSNGSVTGLNPNGSVLIDASGNLFGTTTSGGANSGGIVFELVNSSGIYTEVVLHSFSKIGAGGAQPAAGLVMDSLGNLYGTTEGGGLNNSGTVFELVNSSGVYTAVVLFSFSGGANPVSPVILDTLGNLYGTTQFAGPTNSGTVFELVNSSGTYSEKVLHYFATCDGLQPFAGLMMDPSGNLYGTTIGGGASNDAGTVFELVKSSGPPVPTTTTITSSLNPASAGNPVVLTAGVSSSSQFVASGTITFSSGSSQLGVQPAVCGTATISLEDPESIGVGARSIDAHYTPDVSNLAASSGTISQTVNEPGVVLTNGNNSLTGNQTVNGSVTANSFVGNGSGLTNLTASVLNCTACVGNLQLGVMYAASASQGGAAMNTILFGGLLPSAFQPAGSYATTTSNLFSGDQNIAGNVTLTGALNGGTANFSGPLSASHLLLSSVGTATASQAFNSSPLDSAASVFSSTTGAPLNQLFRWQAEAVANSNNTTNPSATLNLLFGSTATPAETGLSVNPNGTINFAAGQTFPASGSGSGSITAIAAGTGLTGGGTTGTVTLNNAGILSLSATGGIATSGTQNPTVTLNTAFTDARYLGITANAASSTIAGFATNAGNAATLGGMSASAFQPTGAYATTGGNHFTGNQSVVGNVAVTGSLAIGGGTPIVEYVSASQNLTLPALGANSCTTFTTTAISGFTPGTNDTMALGTPKSLMSGLGLGIILTYQAWETSNATSPTITIQVCNPTGNKYKGGNSGTVRVDVFKH